MKTRIPCWMFKATLLFMTAIYPIYAATQSPSSEELIDVVSFVNGAYPYIPFGGSQQNFRSGENLRNQFHAITHNGNRGLSSSFYNPDSDQITLFYALASPATIDSFRISGDNSSINLPLRFEISVSQSPNKNFQTIAVFNTPESYIFGRNYFNFSIPTNKKISGRYMRIMTSGTNHFRNFNLNAYGRLNNPVMLRTDFSGIYPFGYWGSIVSSSDLAMVSRQKGTDYNSYLILHQKGIQINGCYVHGKYINKNDGSGYFEVISDVIGYVTGNIKNNVLHLSRSSVEFHDIRKGLMTLAPTDEGIGRPEIYGYFIVLRDSESENEVIKKAREQGFQSFDGTFNFRYADNTNVKCAPLGKVRFDNVYFNFNSARLTSESKATLDKLVDAALAYPQWKFEISGHTDSTGSTEYNLNLSEQRATVVMRYLVAKGVDATRIQTKNYGATRTLESTLDQSINRRVEIIQQ